MMRTLALTLISVVALAAGAATSFAQEKKGSPETKATGQSERPADPKQAEPESSSHNADKPKPGASTPSKDGKAAAPMPDKKK